MSGNFNHEYLEWSYKVGRQKKYHRHWTYSPFFQNETHVKRFKNYFQTSNQNILSVICFNSPYLAIDLKESSRTAFENKHFWVKKGSNRNLTNLLHYWEKKDTRLPFFEALKEKVGKETFTLAKVQKHRAWTRLVREGKEL